MHQRYQIVINNMGNQICVNVSAKENSNDDTTERHAPNPDRFPEVGDSLSSLPCNINHIRQQLLSIQLKAPDKYTPSPFYKDSFYQLVPDKAYYKGGWKNGYPEGFGEVIFKDKSYFKGYFCQMKAKGPECLFVLRDGSYYLGGVLQNKRNGKGKFVDKSYTYEGEWLNNLPHGNAKETFENGDTFEGRFIQGKRSGNGTYNWAKGEFKQYQGVFKQNMIGQKGRLTMKDQTIIEGIFECNENFHISFATIKTEQYELLNCDIEDGTIQTFEHDGKSYQLKENKKGTGRHYTKNIELSNRKDIQKDQMLMISKVIEEGYQKADRHSDAMKYIQQKLTNYSCKFTNNEDKKEGVIMSICGKRIVVVKKKV